MSFPFKYHASHRYWELALAGRADLWDGPDPLMHNTPQPGYYKARFAGGWEPVMINSQGKAVRGEHRAVEPAEEAWPYCGPHPVSYEAYTQAYETGRFPGEIAGIGHNSGDEASDIVEKALRAKGEALLVLGTLDGTAPAAMGQAKADELANWDSHLLRYAQKLEAQRKAEKLHHTEKARAVDALYQPTIEELRDVRDMIKNKLTPFLLVNPEVRLGGQFSKKRMSLRKRTVAQIDDLVAAATYLAQCEEPHLVEAVQLIANAAAKIKDREPIPGISFIEEAGVQ